LPSDAGISEELIKEFYNKIPILGVCLGHQAIGEVFGGKIIHARRIMHGKTSIIVHDGEMIFKDLPNPIKATRYHSLVIDPTTLPKDFVITATSEDKEIMGIRHKEFNVFGVQFHPESIATENGMRMIRNFISIVKPKVNVSMFVSKLSNRVSLSVDEAEVINDKIMSNDISQVLSSAILMGLSIKGETSDEVLGFANSMLRYAVKVNVDGMVLDNCGTGGDGKHTLNLSTISSFVIAGTDRIKVAKHGNRGVSSKVGSADVLESLGVKIDLPPEKMEKVINEVGIGFLFAPIYHPSMKNVAPIRKELGIKTIYIIS